MALQFLAAAAPVAKALALELGAGIALQIVLDKVLGGWANKKISGAQSAASAQDAAQLLALQQSALPQNMGFRYAPDGRIIGASTRSSKNPSVLNKKVYDLASIQGMPMAVPNPTAVNIPRGVRAAKGVSTVARGVGTAAGLALPYIMQGVGSLAAGAGKTAGAVAEAGGKTAGAAVEALSNVPKALSDTSELQRNMYGKTTVDSLGDVLSGVGKAANVGLSAIGGAANVAGSAAGEAVGGTLSNLGKTMQLYNLINKLSSDPSLVGGRANMVAHLFGYQGMLGRRGT
jgi:hypothetical protein